MKTLLSTALVIAVVAGTSSIARAEFDLGIETEAAFADSEGALAAEEEARRTAEDEKRKLAQQQEIDQRETKKAREMESKAKVQIAKWQDDIKQYRIDRKAAEMRVEKARKEQKKVQSELGAKEAELNALHDTVEQIVAERDQTELMVEQAQEKINRVQQKLAEERKRRLEAQASLEASKKKLADVRSQMKTMRRPASKTSAQPVAKAK